MSPAALPGSLGGAAPPATPPPPAGRLSRLAARFTAWAERWIPDAYVFALGATVIVVVAAFASLCRTRSPGDAAQGVVRAWGGGFWELLPFTLQMALVIITGSVVATTRPVARLIAWLSRVPTTARGAVAWVTFFSMASSWFNWGFSLIFSAMLAREVARRMERVDYRALCASAFLGLGSIWAQGLSGSAALQMATSAMMPPALRDIVAAGGLVEGGVIGLRHTIFLWQSLVSVLVELVVVTAVLFLAAPGEAQAVSAKDLGIDLGDSPLEAPAPPSRGTPGEWLEHHPALPAAFVLLAGSFLALTFLDAKDPLGALTLNTVNLGFLTIGVALHGTPARLMRAVKEATPGVWGVLLQFPLYAGIAALITKTELSQQLAHFFVGLSTRETFPAVVAAYSAVLGVFVPSGGSKWVIEAPYVMQAAHELRVHLGWMVAVYDLGEALANLLQPFWMLPVLGLFGLKARDVMGYTVLVFLVLAPVVLVLVTVLGLTLSYPL
ncbi:MAG: short-chain fatty acid transporter [Myxococcaceae bacterium]|nr:short-chain fatty acid transporter [Myxococcaceae bacterium]